MNAAYDPFRHDPELQAADHATMLAQARSAEYVRRCRRRSKITLCAPPPDMSWAELERAVAELRP